MLLSTVLLASLALAQAPPAPDAVDEAPPTPLEQGIAALQAKDTAGALDAFGRCLDQEPAGSEDATSCRWERGWVWWLQGDWRKVVDDWEAVAKVDPAREGLDRYLSQAKDNLGLEAILAKGREGAAKTYASTAPDGATVRLRAVGDLMISTDFPSGAENPDIETTFVDVAEWLRDADLTFGNLEGPVCDGGKTTKCKPGHKPGSCYAFRTPSRYAKLYQDVGIDVMSTANNHANDFGQYCRLETEKTLDALGIAHTGRPGDIATLESNGLKLAFIGFHTSRNSHYINDHEQAELLVRALASEHDIVVVSFHGGAEGSKAIHVPQGRETFYGENRGSLREFTHTVIDAGADLVLGHGPHVLRGMEVYKDRLIAYSLGNFATYGRFNLSGNLGVGAVLEATLDKQGRFVGGKILPTRQEGEGVPVRDEGAKAVDLVRSLSTDDFPGTAVLVAQDGTLRAP
jgi:poly-gamma-glutamate capsule biosynthesis protein CapA/YwtB (metallophosphatase superfamily)